jgi:Arc/MetJ-type ribon-helix-helix transcriptional regulator
MVRTQIQLPEEQVAFLKKMSAARNESVAQIIRQAIDLLYNSTQGQDNKQRRKQAMAAAGRFRSGAKDLASAHDSHLADIYGR